MHEQPSTGCVVYSRSDSRDLRSVILQDLLHGILFSVERGLAGVERDFEHAGRCAGLPGGVVDVCTRGEDLRHTSGPDCALAVNHQVVEAALCKGQVIC